MTGIPIIVTEPGSEAVNLDLVYDAALAEVTRTLPDAYYSGLVFWSTCRDLAQLHGTVSLTFLQVHPAIPSQQVVLAIARVDTLQHDLDIEYRNITDIAWVTERHVFKGHQSIVSIVATAQRHIVELGVTSCNVVLTEMFDGSWDVRCGWPTDTEQKCHFSIRDGRITGLQ